MIPTRHARVALLLLTLAACGQPSAEAKRPVAAAPSVVTASAPLPAPATSSAALARPPRIPLCSGPAPAAHAEAARQVLQSGHVFSATEAAISNTRLLATISQFDETLRIWDVLRGALVSVQRIDAHGVDLAWDDA